MDEPGFTSPVPPVPPSSSKSSVETPVDGRRKCRSCPRRMSKKSADRHTLCIACWGFDCDLNNRCEECLEWSEDEVIKYAKYRKSLKSRESSSRAKTTVSTPLTPSGHSPQPAPQAAPLTAPQPAPRPSQRDDIQSQVDSLASNFKSLSDNLTSQLSDFMTPFLCHNQSSRQPRLGPDAGESHPGRTAGESRMFQGEGAPAGRHWSLHTILILCLVTLGLRCRSSQTVLRHAHLLLPCVPLPVRLHGLLQPFRLLRNPPCLVGFHLTLLRLDHVTTRLRLTRRSVKVNQSRLLMTPLPLGWLNSFMRSALTLALSLILRLLGAVLRPGLVNQRLRPRSSASDCTLTSRRYRRRWLLGRSLWLDAPSHCRV